MSPDRASIAFSFTSLPNGWQVGRFEALGQLAGTVHAVTTRNGPEFTASAPAAANDDCRRLADALGLWELAYCEQVHGVEIARAAGGGPAGQCDGLMTSTPGRGVMAFSADCPLILAADVTGKAVAVAHASWRGTVKRIATRLIEGMSGEYGVVPADVIACIGPAVGPCCYEVGSDVQRAAVRGIGLHAERFCDNRDGKRYFDLWAANRDELIRAGVAAENVHTARLCTVCHNDLFPSYRVEGEAAPRFVAVIGRTASA